MSTTVTTESASYTSRLENPRHGGAAEGSVLNTCLSDSAPVRLHEVPTFQDKYEERRWAKGQMAAAFRIFAKLGFADGASGHISLRGIELTDAQRSH